MRQPTRPRGSRVRELLAFDLALCIGQTAARPRGAPSPLPSDLGRGRAPQRRTLVGFDEAGRGALAGPVVVGCVQLPWELLEEPDRIAEDLRRVDDSKCLTARAREAALLEIARCAVWAVGCASAGEIDAVGIVEAARRAACRAYRRLGTPCDLAVFDRGLSMGGPVPLDPDPENGVMWGPVPAPGDSRRSGLSILPRAAAFTRGDMRSLHVAAASIVAKVTRDHLMERLDAAFPGFELSRHKGYGTEEHRRAISRLGPSPIHRRTFLHFTEEAQSQSC